MALRYARTESGAKTATTATQATRAQPTSAVTVPVLARSRTAETTCETGLICTNFCSQLGSVSSGTKALDRNVSGNMIIIEIPCTDWALRPMIPTKVKIQASDQPVTITSRVAETTPKTPPAGR